MDQANHPLEVFRFCPRCGSKELTRHYGRAIRCEDCGFEYFFNSSGAIIALIFNEKGDLLVTRRAFPPAKGALDFPGGFIDPNETAEETVIREIKEELNLEVTGMKFLFTNPNQYPYSGIIIHTIDLIFEVRVAGFDTLKVDDDVSECFFMPTSEFRANTFGLQLSNNVIRKLGWIK